MQKVLIRFVESKKKLNVQDYEEYFHNKVIQKVKTIKKEDCKYKYFDLQEYKNIMLYDCNYELDFLKNGINIDNISLYYEFMSDVQKIHLSHNILSIIFFERFTQISDLLKISKTFLTDDKLINTKYYKTNNTSFPDIFDDGFCFWYSNNMGIIEVSYFGIKDTLKPIDEYIAEIKENEAYKNYIAKKA